MIITNDFELIAALEGVNAIWDSANQADEERLEELVNAIMAYESERF